VLLVLVEDLILQRFDQFCDWPAAAAEHKQWEGMQRMEPNVSVCVWNGDVHEERKEGIYFFRVFVPTQCARHMTGRLMRRVGLFTIRSKVRQWLMPCT
jgi:CMP-2-keto-3-deoxyoctulosonic acid synthetase